MLTDAAVKNAQATEKPAKLFDGGGLYLLIIPAGSRWWRFKYRYAGKEKLLSLGTYPDVSLKRARAKRDDARRLLSDGIDPGAQRKVEKLSQADTFEKISAEWLDLQRKNLSPASIEKAEWMFNDLLFPALGSQPINSIGAPDILPVLRKLETRGKHDTAHRLRQRCGQVFRYAVVTGRALRDPTTDLRGALAPIVVTHRAAITDPQRIGELLRAIDDYEGQPATAAALKLAPLVFARPIELRAAQWSEFRLTGKEPEWRIPAERMKMGDLHIVPLASQALEILKELETYTGDGKFLFPSLRTSARPISENTINAALRRLGYTKDDMTAHGFRAMASTQLNEQGWAPDLIELQLAHAERNKVRAAYNRAERLAERRTMMQAWADYLDGLKIGGKVVAIKSARR